MLSIVVALLSGVVVGLAFRLSDRLIGGQAGAATRLGIPRTTLVYKMRKLGIETGRSQRVRSIQQRFGEAPPLMAGGLRTVHFEAIAS